MAGNDGLLDKSLLNTIISTHLWGVLRGV
jgi:hypothetical protein